MSTLAKTARSVLAAAALLAVQAGAHAYPSGLVPGELRARMTDVAHVYTVDAASGTGSIQAKSDYGSLLLLGVLYGDVGPALLAKPFEWQLNAALDLEAAIVSGDLVTQSFSAIGGLSIKLAGQTDNFLTATISGGSIQGILGSTDGVTMTFQLATLSSDNLSLSGLPTTLTLTGPSSSALALAGNGSYLGSFDLSAVEQYDQPVTWYVPGSAFAAAVPEPQTWLLLALGLGAAAGVARRRG